MTDRLVGEILLHISSYTFVPARISFVGHSLGCILIRSAISRPEMGHLVPRFYTYLSLSGPHLGTLYNNSGLVNMGKKLSFDVCSLDNKHFDRVTEAHKVELVLAGSY